MNDLNEAVAAVERAGGLERYRVRKSFEERFSAARMTSDYLAVYESLGSPITRPSLVA